MNRYHLAASLAVLLAASNASGQTFDPDAPPRSSLTLAARFGQPALPPTPRSYDPATPVRLMVQRLEFHQVVPKVLDPCAEALARAQAADFNRLLADSLSRARHDAMWDFVGEVIGGFLGDGRYPLNPYPSQSPDAMRWPNRSVSTLDLKPPPECRPKKTARLAFTNRAAPLSTIV